MDEQQRHLLIAYKKALGDDLLTEDIFSYLQSTFVLELDDVELIKAEKTSRRRVEKLLLMLPEKGAAGFKHFYDALLDAEYEHLAELLEPGLSDVTDSGGQVIQNDKMRVETVLRDGGVPQKPSICMPRPEALRLLQNALSQLQHTIGWVVLHGMAGSGKTVLACDALHDAKLLQECFPGGVFWLTLGAVDNNKLLMKMQNLCSWLDNSDKKTLPRNLEDARNILRDVLAHQHPRSLLILDDLWSPDDARYFDVQARVLVTTRYSSVSDHVAGLVLKVPIPDSFSNAQSKLLLAAYLGIPVGYLPHEADEIIDECRGSPLAIALLGALLKSHPNRWKYYVDQLKSNKVSKLKSKLAYKYPSLFEAIGTSVIHLPEDLRKRYEYFALFDEDTKIPAKVFCILWDEEVIEVEDTMDELVAFSLVKRQPIRVDSPYEAYGIHDLQLDYLKESVSAPDHSPSLKELHHELINKYYKLCNGNWTQLSNDGYIHWHLITHMVNAGQSSLAFDLLTNFDWIATKVQVTGTPSLIGSYDFLTKNVGDEIRCTLKDFRNFIGAHSNLLSDRSGGIDVLQLALGNPGSDSVYHTAKMEAQRRVVQRKGWYFDWSNRQQVKSCSDGLLLTVQPHSGAVFSCHVCPSNAQNAVVSCGGDSIVKVWDIDSGEEILSLDGHTDTVYCCRFSYDGEKIVTSSADKTVKIWSYIHGQHLLTMGGHQGDVFCCAFSPDGKRVISCSVDKTIRVWDSTTGFLLAALMGHTDGVNWCAYSPDGSKIVSASNDLTVKVWNSTTGQIMFSFGGFDEFYSFCTFSTDGNKIVAATQNYIQLLDAQDGSLMKHIVTSSEVICASHSRDGRFAVSGHADTVAQLWDIEKEVCVAVFEGHAGFVRGICFNADASKIVTASEDGTCKVWKIIPGGFSRNRLRKVFDVDFQSQDNLVTFAVDSLNKVQKIVTKDNEVSAETAPISSKVSTCCLSSDKRYFCACCQDGSIQVFLTEDLDFHWNVDAHNTPITDCCFRDSGQLLTASEAGDIQVLDVTNKQMIQQLKGHEGEITKLLLFQNGIFCLSSSYDGTLKVWDVANGTCVFTCVHYPNETLLCCDVSPDGKYLVSGSAERTAKLWDACSGTELHLLQGHSDCVRCAKFSPTSRTVLTGSDDGTIKLWDLTLGSCLKTFLKHIIWVRDLHFSEDGKAFVSISDDIKFWNMTGLVQTYKIRGNFLKYIRVSGDFATFVTIDDRGELYILKQIRAEDA